MFSFNRMYQRKCGARADRSMFKDTKTKRNGGESLHLEHYFFSSTVISILERVTVVKRVNVL